MRRSLIAFLLLIAFTAHAEKHIATLDEWLLDRLAHLQDRKKELQTKSDEADQAIKQSQKALDNAIKNSVGTADVERKTEAEIAADQQQLNQLENSASTLQNGSSK